MSKPLLSVVMAHFNHSEYLSEAIESVLQQSFSDFEFIIIDDASNDDSWNIIQAFSQKDSRIHAFRNDRNLRICKSLNLGIAKAQGKYIARFDSDDICFPSRFERQITFLESHEKVGVVGSNFFIIDAKGKYIRRKEFPHSDKACRKSLWFRNPFGHNTVMIRRECFEEFGGYNEEYLYAEDLELWLRFGQKYQFHNLPEYLVKYRVYGENTVFQKQKIMVLNTLKARKKALEYGYTPTFTGKIFYIGTWLSRFLPTKWVFWSFQFLTKIL